MPIPIDDTDPYDVAMRAAIMPELAPLLEEQTRMFQRAAQKFFEGEGGKEPPWLKAWDCAGTRLNDQVVLARKKVLEELEAKNGAG